MMIKSTIPVVFGGFRHLNPLKALLSPLGRGEDGDLKKMGGNLRKRHLVKQLRNFECIGQDVL